MIMTLTEAFTKLGKIMPVYNKLAAVILKVEGGVLTVSGVARGQSFRFTTEIKDKDITDFTITVAPDVLSQALKLNVTDIKYSNGSLIVTGIFGTSASAPEIEIKCDAVIEALATDVAKLDQKIYEYVEVLEDGTEICNALDVLKPWQALAKCGRRIFITEDLAYSTSPSTNAFYVKEKACQNLPETTEPLQAESTFVAEVAAIQQAFGIEKFNIYTMNEGTVFIALSEDKKVYAVEGAPVRIERNTLDRIKRRYADVCEFDTLTLPQSAVRDILQTAADKEDVKVHTEQDSLVFSSGAFGKIKVDTSTFDCECEVAREHTILALSALPTEAEMVFGYGDSEARNFISFTASDVTIIVPVQDITEI